MNTLRTTREEARRLARAIAVDMALYREHLVTKAKETGEAPSELVVLIREGWDLYNARVVPELEGRAEIFNAAIRERVWPGWGGAS